MAFLPGLLSLVGGPGGIIKSVGGFVGDVLEGVSKGEPIGKTLAQAGAHGIRRLIGEDEQRESLGPASLPPQAANARNMIIPKMDENIARRIRPRVYNQSQRVAREAYSEDVPHKVAYRATPGGYPAVKYARIPAARGRRPAAEDVEVKSFEEAAVREDGPYTKRRAPKKKAAPKRRRRVYVSEI